MACLMESFGVTNNADINKDVDGSTLVTITASGGGGGMEVSHDTLTDDPCACAQCNPRTLACTLCKNTDYSNNMVLRNEGEYCVSCWQRSELVFNPHDFIPRRQYVNAYTKTLDTQITSLEARSKKIDIILDEVLNELTHEFNCGRCLGLFSGRPAGITHDQYQLCSSCYDIYLRKCLSLSNTNSIVNNTQTVYYGYSSMPESYISTSSVVPREKSLRKLKFSFWPVFKIYWSCPASSSIGCV